MPHKKPYGFNSKKLNICDDPVSHPSHYTDGKIEVIDYIEDKKLGFHLGNAVKYISRAGKKDPNKYIEDLRKAIWYINREIERELKSREESYKSDSISIPSSPISDTDIRGIYPEVSEDNEPIERDDEPSDSEEVEVVMKEYND